MAAWATPELAHVDLNWNIIRKVHKRWTSIAMFEYQRGNHLDLFNDLIFFLYYINSSDGILPMRRIGMNWDLVESFCIQL